MPKRSKSYNPSTHGTGWKTGHPTDAEVRFLNNANVDNNDKVKFITGAGATPPTSLATPVSIPQQQQPQPIMTAKKTTTTQEDEVGLSGIVTSHYIINYSKTGFPTRRFKINYPKVPINIA